MHIQAGSKLSKKGENCFMNERILIIEDDSTFRSLMNTILRAEGLNTTEAENAEKGLELLKKHEFDIVLSDMRLPGMSGLDLFRLTRNEASPPAFIVLTAFGTIEEAVSAIKEGVFDFLTKPLKDPDSLRSVVQKAIETRKKDREYLHFKECEAAGIPPEELIFAGNSMADIKKMIIEVAPTQATVLIQGESGTGKELAARAIHLASARKASGFVTINCAAIPENLMESEMFGHERGAFTGAMQARRGKFELAQGGTLFLDEIGELPLPLQAKLLRVLQEKKFERVGGSKEIAADARIIAATNRSLEAEVKEKRFREDLFYRINVFPITLPSLRERVDAIPNLAKYFLHKFRSITGKHIESIDHRAMEALKKHKWPGNIRELQNAIERAVILGRDRLTLENFPGISHDGNPLDNEAEPILDCIEKLAILDTLKKCGNNRRITADKLGISKRTLQYRLKKYGITGN